MPSTFRRTRTQACSTTIKIKDYDVIGKAAEKCEIERSTLRSAVNRGELTTQKLASGTVIVKISDVKKWSKTHRPLGRPAKQGSKGIATSLRQTNRPASLGK